MTTLGFRLTRLLTSRCNIYREDSGSGPNSSTKKRADQPGYSLVASNVPFMYDPTLNEDNAGPIGRIKARGVFTEDNAVMPVGTDVKSGDYIKDITADANGGTVSRVMGRPRLLPGAPGRPVDSLTLRLMEDEEPPTLG